MKRLSVAVALLLALGATSAQADRWVPRKKLPKPIDYPVIRKNVKEDHKPGKRQNHPPSGMSSIRVAVPTANA
jgi:hypothetical protein